MFGGPKKFMVGLAAGAGLMYLFDPERGRRRRALLRDQVTHARGELDDLGQTAVARSRDLRNRARGLVAEAAARVQPEEVEESVLVERVRSSIGRVVANPGALDVSVEGGTVILAGRVLSDEVQDVVDTVRHVRGVERVENRLEVHREPGDVSDLQGTKH